MIDPLGPFVYLDANVVIHIIEDSAPHAPAIDRLAGEADAGRMRFATSELTLAEVLVRPLRTGNAAAAARYRAFLSPSVFMTMTPVSRVIFGKRRRPSRTDVRTAPRRCSPRDGRGVGMLIFAHQRQGDAGDIGDRNAPAL